MKTKPKRSAPQVALGHVVALRGVDSLRHELVEIFERHVECRRVLEDIVFYHITDAHPECPPHDDPEHTRMCCVYKRAQAALLQADLDALGPHPCKRSP